MGFFFLIFSSFFLTTGELDANLPGEDGARFSAGAPPQARAGTSSRIDIKSKKRERNLPPAQNLGQLRIL